MSTHRAFFGRDEQTSLWWAECALCGAVTPSGERRPLRWSGLATEAIAEAWASGHNTAVARQRHVAETGPVSFPAVETALPAANLAVMLGELDEDVFVVQPADRPPLLHLWGPAQPEGYRRAPVGAICLERGWFLLPG